MGVLGIILLFFRSGSLPTRFSTRPLDRNELFAQVMRSAVPEVLRLWEEGDDFIPKTGAQCPKELQLSEKVGRSYYQCQPHLWQCFWEGGLGNPVLKVEHDGQTYHVRARPSFPAIKTYSESPRYYEMKFTRPHQQRSGLEIPYGMVVELEVREFPGKTQALLLADTCRDVYLPERIYGYGKPKDKKTKGFEWDNFGRRIFIDRFTVSQQQVNEWHLLTGRPEKVEPNPLLWGHPAYLGKEERREYCHFVGRKPLEAKLFDAATMAPGDLQNPLPTMVLRPSTPWQRDLSKTFLGVARINPDYQLTPLDCQLAQVKGCKETYFTTDSATWMGINFGLGFEPEIFENTIEPSQNLKLSSRHLPPASTWHELGVRTTQDENSPKAAFRCYTEVVP